MKIGIITLSASYNCGSMLQSYALKKILERYGDVEIINFSSQASHQIYDIVPKTLKGKIYTAVSRSGLLSELKKEARAYQNFQRKNLEISGKEFFLSDLFEIATKYDVIVAGSDQVWNVCMGDFDKGFFCGWTDRKKVAYAPSLGGHDIRESKSADEFIELLKKFDYLSVREEEGKKCIEEVSGKTVPVVLDPTLLYGEKKWSDLVQKPIIKGNYMFYYSWAYCYEELRNIVRERSKESGMPVYVIDAHKWREHDYRKDGFTLCNVAGPLAFLNLMYYAKECYVESFHGMLFAYMFKKNFWLLDTHQSYEQIDTRLRELIELIGATDRVLTTYNEKNIDMGTPIDYEKINDRLVETKKLESYNYIEGALF